MFIFSGKAHYSKSTFLTLLFSKQIYLIDRLFQMLRIGTLLAILSELFNQIR